jgi:HlyD family secretion protein
MQLDPRLIDADRETTSGEYAHLGLQLRRIDAELAGVTMPHQAGDPAALFERISQQGIAHRQAYLDAIAGERALAEKLHNDVQAALALQAKLEKTLPIFQRSAEAYEHLLGDGFISRIAADDKQRQLLETTQDLRAQQAAVASLQAMLVNSEKKLAQLASGYRSELLAERASIDAQLRRVTGEKEKLEYKSGLLSLRAPQAGIVKDLSTHTVGTVVAPGTVLMSLVPQDEPLRAEVMVRNEDAGFIHLGQPVKVKLAAYPFQKYGMIDGVIDHIGPDVADPAAGSREGLDPAQTFARYPVWVRLSSQHLSVDGKPLLLTPGMQVVVDIHQGRRSVLEYLLSPVRRAWMESARER